MGLTDCHAHLCDPAFDADRADVVERARAAGVTAVVAVGETIEDARANLELSREYPGFVRPAVGLFPTHLDLAAAAEMETFVREHREALAAIGEVGLDHWKVQDEAGRELQREIFRRFIDLALELDLPLNVHSRSAARETIAALLDRGAKRVQLHAFDGRATTAKPAVEAGWLFSVPPSIVRSRQKQKLVRQLPLSCLLLESDSPVLGPDPALRNEPANLAVSLRAIAEIKGIPVEGVDRAIAENTRRLYNVGPCATT